MVDLRIVNGMGAHLQFREWLIPDGIATVCLIHGIGEHSGRYQYVADYFNRRGFSVIGFDHQGHGRSSGKRGDAFGLESMLDDVEISLAEAWEKGAASAVFLYGHSMGGNLVLNHLLRRRPAVAGAVITGPWIRLPTPPPKLLLSLAKLVRPLWPSMTQPNRVDVNELSSDPRVIASLQEDPLAHNRVSIRMGLDLIRAAQYLDHYRGPISCPVLLMHGGADKITCPNGTKHFAGRVNGDVTMRLWNGLKHEIHHEPQKDMVLGCAADWMTHHVR